MGFIQNLFRGADGFAQPVGLTHNGKLHFKSICGGIMTILVFALAIGYGILLLADPVDLSSKYTIFKRDLIQLKLSFLIGKSITTVTSAASASTGSGNTGSGNTSSGNLYKFHVWLYLQVTLLLWLRQKMYKNFHLTMRGQILKMCTQRN